MSVDSDVKLMPGQVVLDSWDLCLDSPDRRKPDVQTPFRRALVHGPGDGLVVNWGNDYPDGVTINRLHRVTGHPAAIPTGTIFQDHIHSQKTVRFTAQGSNGFTTLAQNQAGRLVLDQPKHLHPGVQFNVPVNVHKVISESPLTVWDYELSDQLLLLSKTINELTERVDAIATLAETVLKLQAEVGALKAQIGQAQSDWRWCKNCQGLFFAGSPPATNKKPCAAGGDHSQEGSADYRLLT